MIKSVVFFVIFYTSFAFQYYENTNGREISGRRQKASVQSSLFPSLENYQVGAVAASERSYPWVARVVHSPTNDFPHMCTAVCIDERIFVTAARCLFGLKINYTRILYLDYQFVVTAFVVPSEPTKQAFDDIGFLVVESRGNPWNTIELYDGPKRTDADFQWFEDLRLHESAVQHRAVGYTVDKPTKQAFDDIGFLVVESRGNPWNTIELYDGPKRTDTDFQWFEDLRLHESAVQHRAVGYTVDKYAHRVRNPFTRYQLSVLDVVVGRNMCAEIFTLNRIVGFYVPCYHSCNLNQYRSNDPKCKKYLGVEGGVIYNFKTNKLLGIATWGAYFYKYELPVGFAVPNSVNFKSDYECAKTIRDDPSRDIVKGYYQALCNDMSFRYR